MNVEDRLLVCEGGGGDRPVEIKSMSQALGFLSVDEVCCASTVPPAETGPTEGISLCSRLKPCSRQCPVELGDLAGDERSQRVFQLIVVPLHFLVVLFLVLTNQSLVLPQGILTPLSEVFKAEA